MEKLHSLNSDALVDLLSKQTVTYLRMQTEGGSVEEFIRCKLLLRAVQKELNERNKYKLNNRKPGV
jgi:hypothetical protein